MFCLIEITNCNELKKSTAYFSSNKDLPNNLWFTFIKLCVQFSGIFYSCIKKSRKISHHMRKRWHLKPFYWLIDTTLWIKVNLKSYCTPFLYCPVNLDWLDCTALIRPLCRSPLSLSMLYELKWRDQKKLKHETMCQCAIFIFICAIKLLKLKW